MLVLGYYGVGKTTIKNEKWIDLTDEGKPSLSLLKYAVEHYEIVMADPTWEKVFVKSGYEFHIVVPSLDRKEEFINNFKERNKKGLGGGDKAFCAMVSQNWERDIKHFLSLPAASHTILQEGKFMKDFIDKAV